MAFYGRGGGSILYANVPGEDGASAVTLASAGGTETLVADGAGPALTTKGLSAGTGVSLGSTGTAVTIINSSPASSVTLGTVGIGENLIYDGVGPALELKSLTAGTNVTLVPGGTDLTVNAATTTLASAGGESLVTDGTGPSLEVKGLAAGTGITLTPAATTLTLSVTNPAPPLVWGTAYFDYFDLPIGPGLPYTYLGDAINYQIGAAGIVPISFTTDAQGVGFTLSSGGFYGYAAHNNRFTISVAGHYRITATCSMSSSSLDTHYLFLVLGAAGAADNPFFGTVQLGTQTAYYAHRATSRGTAEADVPICMGFTKIIHLDAAEIVSFAFSGSNGSLQKALQQASVSFELVVAD